jgi:hypothetical protein
MKKFILQRLIIHFFMTALLISPVFLASCSDDDDASPVDTGDTSNNNGNGGEVGGYGAFQIALTGSSEADVKSRQGDAMTFHAENNDNMAMLSFSLVALDDDKKEYCKISIALRQYDVEKIEEKAHTIVSNVDFTENGAFISLTLNNQHYQSTGNGSLVIESNTAHVVSGKFVNVEVKHLSTEQVITINGTFEARPL